MFYYMILYIYIYIYIIFKEATPHSAGPGQGGWGLGKVPCGVMLGPAQSCIVTCAIGRESTCIHAGTVFIPLK